MAHELPKLDYEYSALEPHIDAKTMEIHHTKHHQGYVDKLNAALQETGLEDKPVDELLKDLSQIPEDKKQAVINNGGGHSNHTLFWQIMTPNAKQNPEGTLAEAINQKFESFENFKEKFAEAAKTRFGSGWAWLVINENKELEIISTQNQDSPLSQNKIPILSLDVWEHAYYLKYQNKRPDYIEAWWNVVNWDKVQELYEQNQ